MLTLHHLEFELECTTPLGLYDHSGTALRAALYAALSRHFCSGTGRSTGAAEPLHQSYCPVCWLLALEVAESERGKDVPRALALKPPAMGARTDYSAGERWRFGLTLFGEQALNLLPYTLLAVHAMGASGVGRPVDRGRRGRFALRRVWAANPFAESREVLLAEGETVVTMPSLGIGTEEVEAAAARWAARAAASGGRLTLRFLTPARIVEQGRLVHAPRFPPLLARVVGRLEQLAGLYGDGRRLDGVERAQLLGAAGQVRLVEDRTHWADVKSPSGQKAASTPIGGFVGEATYQTEEWSALLPWLLWGQVAQAGKNTTKGNGWYEVRAGERRA